MQLLASMTSVVDAPRAVSSSLLTNIGNPRPLNSLARHGVGLQQCAAPYHGNMNIRKKVL